LRKEYVITEITAAPDGSPYVLITLTEPRDMKERQRPVYNQQVSLSSPDELFKNIGRLISTQMVGGVNTVIKMGLNEYEELNVKVGDRVYLDISKAEWVSV
jgi:hypothetical protein